MAEITSKYLLEYIDIVNNSKVPVCEEQVLLIKHIQKVFREEDIYTDDEQTEKYFALQRFFPYKLFAWEKFCFVLHNCTYNRDGTLRFPDLFIYVGRGSGKNGYLTFEDFALTTPVNGVKNYHISTFAASEANAKTSFMELHDIILDNKKLSEAFKVTLEVIKNIKTGSEITFHTSNAKTKDGGRQGKINLDELHTFENYDLMNVALTGLGKKEKTRTTYTTTDGDVRDGPLDNIKEKSMRILQGEEADNGFIPFMCRCTLEEINDPANWVKAVPSLNEFPELKRQMTKEFADFVKDPITYSSFATKRCNCPYGEREAGITKWENIKACCSGERPENFDFLEGQYAVFGVDFTKANDFAAACIVILSKGVKYVISHTWICRNSADLYRINFPLDMAVMRGEAEWVDDVEIQPELIADWVDSYREKYSLIMGGADNYRWALLRRGFEAIGYKGEIRRGSNEWGKKRGLIYINRPSDTDKNVLVLLSDLEQRKLYFGDNMIMRWYLQNTKKVEKNGSVRLEKVDKKSRKTDGVMALLAAYPCINNLEPYDKSGEDTEAEFELTVRTY
ncbi:MAG: terminase large subunit [Ruminococcus sp.]|nr:terminase large subunit [Ruminococcus sp.]